MSETNPYQAPQEALSSARAKIDPQTLVPWEDEGRRALQDVAKHHRWMMWLYLVFLVGGACSIFNYLVVKNRIVIDFQTLPAVVVYYSLIFHVYQLAKLVNKSWTPLISLLVMFLVPYSLVVPIYYHRRAVHIFAHFGIRLGWLGISSTQLDTRIATEYDAFRMKGVSPE